MRLTCVKGIWRKNMPISPKDAEDYQEKESRAKVRSLQNAIDNELLCYSTPGHPYTYRIPHGHLFYSNGNVNTELLAIVLKPYARFRTYRIEQDKHDSAHVVFTAKSSARKPVGWAWLRKWVM